MYLSNKYTKWYNRIITVAQNRTIDGYVERHHIIPKSLGGNNSKNNIVRLTAREHFICHLLLIRMLSAPDVYKMVSAVWRMANNRKGGNKYKVTSRCYEVLRVTRKNVKMSVEAKAKSSATKRAANLPAWNKGIPRTDAEKALMSVRRKAVADNTVVWNKGRPHPEDTLAKITEKAKARKKYKCPHCQREIAGTNYFRWHGDNCKLNK